MTFDEYQAILDRGQRAIEDAYERKLADIESPVERLVVRRISERLAYLRQAEHDAYEHALLHGNGQNPPQGTLKANAASGAASEAAQTEPSSPPPNDTQ